MAHQLATNPGTGGAAFLSANQDIRPLPWDHLGIQVKGAATVREALVAAGLDFTIERRPVMFNYGSEDAPVMRSMPNQFVDYRTDTGEALGVVSARCPIAQNQSALGLFDVIASEYGAVIETAGVLNAGRQTYISAKMPAHTFVPGDEITPYVLLINSHAARSAQVLITPVRVVCNNTLLMALGRHSNRVSVTHTNSADQRLREAGRVMGLYHQFVQEMSGALTHLTYKRVSEKQVDAYIARLFPSDSEAEGRPTSMRSANIRETVKGYLYGSAGGQQLFPGTAYQAYQGVTGFFQNVKEYRTSDGVMAQQLLGDDGRTMHRAFELAGQLGN
jgi:phage/plasmid-like protein (TIGR03299 family)